MSILAEPRRKQRISIDPQNIQWRDDDNKLSKKMMEKMGWADGKGLGKNNHGNVDAVKLNANHTGKGLGADKMASYDSTWIGHHDDFADLLAALNKNKPKSDETAEEKKERTDKISIELSSKSIRRRIHYQKFTRMKDTANYSDKDKSAVLGIGLKRTKDSDEDSKEDVKSDPDSNSQGNTTVSNLSIGDYFAAKMAALKTKSQSCATVVTVKTEVEEEEYKTEVEEEEYKISSSQYYTAQPFSYEEPVKKEMELEDDSKAIRKAERKLRKQKEAELAESKIIKQEVEEEQELDEDAERKRRKEEKRQRKLLKKQLEEENVEKEEKTIVEEELTDKQRRKMEKRMRRAEEEAAAVETEDEPKKKKKRNTE